MQSNKTTNTDSPVESNVLTDAAWLDVINQCTKNVFDDIYFAAKNKNKEALAAIKTRFLCPSDRQTPYYTTVFWNGETPISLLAFEGEMDAVNFLKQESTSADPSFETQVQFGVSKRTKNLADIPETIYFDYPSLDLIVAASLMTPDQPWVHVIEHSPFKEKAFSAYVHAALGNVARVNELLVDLKRHNAADYFPVIMSRIAYLYAKQGHHNEVQLLWAQGDSMVRQSIIESYLQSGYVNQLNKLFNSFSYLSPADWNAHYRLKYTSQRGNYNHALILLPLLAGINSPEMRGVIFDRVFYAADDKVAREHCKTNMLHAAAGLNRCIKEYHLSFAQALICVERVTLKQIDLVQQGKMSANEFIAMLAEGSENKLTKEEALDFFDQVKFAGTKTALIDDLNKYAAPIYNSQRHHVQREMSFKAACLKADSSDELGQLIAKQLGLFAGTEKGDAKSLYKHEQPLRNKTQDEFPAILRKYQ